MRSNEQFKALVYDRAEKVSAENKKKRALMMRGIATFSLIAVIGGVFLYSNNRNKLKENMYDSDNNTGIVQKLQNESRIYSADKPEECVVSAVLADSVYFSSDDVMAVEAETYSESAYEVDDFSYKNDVFSYSSKNFEEQTHNISGKGTGSNLSVNDVVDIAKELCTINYNTHKVYFDNDNNVWKIAFYTTGTTGGDQCVYLDANGNVKMIIYGE